MAALWRCIGSLYIYFWRLFVRPVCGLAAVQLGSHAQSHSRSHDPKRAREATQSGLELKNSSYCSSLRHSLPHAAHGLPFDSRGFLCLPVAASMGLATPVGPLAPCWGARGPCDVPQVPQVLRLRTKSSRELWTRCSLSEQMCLKYRACAENLASRNSPPDPADPADLPETDPAEQTRPYVPRAGGQDDGS